MNAEHALIRLSSAIQPPSAGATNFVTKALLRGLGGKLREANLFPCAAVKVFRQGCPSGNLLFAASKTGQPETDFFAHCVCTNLTEKVSMPLQPVIGKFREFSNFPLSLGRNHLS